MKQLLLIFSCILLLGCTHKGSQKPVARDGIIDLSGWDISKDGSVSLDGKWEFYWNKLYTPQDFSSNAQLPLTGYIEVPGTWEEQDINGSHFPGKGFATYRLKVKMKGDGGLLALKLRDAATSFTIWVNGNIVASSGKVSADPLEMKPKYESQITSFNAGNGDLEIIAQVANNFHSKGGLWTNIVLGNHQQVEDIRDRTFIYEIFLFGVMFILFIYHVLIFLLRKSEKAALWFGILCFVFLMRSGTTTERYLYLLFPDFNLNIGLRIEYITLTLSAFFYTLFVSNLFPHDFSKKVLNFIAVVSCVECAVILFTNTTFYTSMLGWFQLLTVLKALYVIIMVSPRTVSLKRLGSIPFFISLVILVACVINDILTSRLIIDTPTLTPVAFFLLALSQAYILAARISYAYHTIEESSFALSDAKALIEQKFEQLETSERKFRNIINTSTSYIGMIDRHTVLSFVSPSFKKALGYKADEMVGQSALRFIHKDDWQSVNEAFEKAALNPRKLLQLEARFIAKDGTEIYVDMRASPIFENKVPTGAIVMSNDITHRILDKQRQEEYKVMLEQRVEERTEQLSMEKKKSDDLLLNILPEEVAEELKQKGSSEARQYENVTVMFTDFVNFTGISELLSPKDLVAEIDKCFKAFDQIIEKHGLEKIKTIGDAYLAVCGLPNEDPQHALKAMRAAVEIRDLMTKQKEKGGKFDIRIGLNSGPLVAGIVGFKKFAYDIWGDTVNTAARMEQHSETGKINISGTTYALVKDAFSFTPRGKIGAKNKGEIDMYFVS
jgi:PAS domain S-box-containing protein